MKRKIEYLLGLTLLLFIVAACSDDDDGPTQAAKESAQFTVTVTNNFDAHKYFAAGVFNTPDGAASPAPVFPGESYSFEFYAAPGMKLSFATMFVQSNDLFYAPDENGIDLYDNSGAPITGDITSLIKLWDAGSEIDEEPGLGVNQAPRQAGANSGAADPNPNVRLADDGFNNLPMVSDVIRVTLSSVKDSKFKVMIENVSSGTTISLSDGNTTAAPIAPGVFVLHTESAPLFMSNTPNNGMGLAELAEDGDPSKLISYLNNNSGLVSPFAPGLFVVHTSEAPLYTEGLTDRGEGLENLAEDGDPSLLISSISNNSGIKLAEAFNTPDGSSQPGVIFPMQSYSFTFKAEDGDMLSLATMLVQSNDLFIGTKANGLELFNSNGVPLTGDVTSMLYLLDAGTEINEYPGVGSNQAPRQSGANTGGTKNGNVMKVNDGFNYPSVSQSIKVTIEAQ